MMNRAVFLDRDGVINWNEGNHYVFRKEDFRINDGVLDFLEAMQQEGYLLIVISNQGGISKGLYSKEDAELLHALLIEACLSRDIRLSEIYFCPHHDSVGNCLCRKPQPLMLQKAMGRFNIDPAASWFIGDRDKDEEAGRAAGVRTLKIRANENLNPYRQLILGNRKG